MAINEIKDIVDACPSNGNSYKIDIDYIGGIITSDFRSGCFYRRIALADDTGYVEIMVDNKQYEYMFPYGASVELRCRGLYAAIRGNIVVIGKAGEEIVYPDGTISYQIVPLETPNELLNITVTGHTNLQPIDGEITNPQGYKQGLIVKFDNVQFTDEHLGQPWGDYKSLNDVFRHITDRDGNTFPVMVPSYAWFAYRMLPSGSGHIEGIMQRSRRTPYQYLKVFDARKIKMDNARFEATPKGPFLTETELM